ncbi:MAG: cobalamin biosynthesis protein CobU [Ruminococcaceae bacterium]|nr:cobalamin biosynthesis protein CobU [Oscillospiraceae bacterium]
MHLIIGGAYQGKLDYAKENFNIGDSIHICKDVTIDFSKKCIYNVEDFTLACVRAGIEAKDYFKEHSDEWKDSIIISTDIFCGVVPIDVDIRAMREMHGRLLVYLTKKADTVTRIFCGLGQRLK